MLLDILTRVAEDAGYEPTQQRAKLLRLINKATREIYQELECNNLMREVSCTVGRNKLMALPTFIGELRGMRQHNTEAQVPLEPMSPRYASSTLGYKWKNWRDLGMSPFHTLPANIDTLTFESVVLEDAIVTTIGQTNVAAREAESVTIDASPKDTTKLFNPAGIKSISSASTRTADITVKDATGVEVATLYNNETQTRYKLVDVSELFWGQDTADGDTLVDILYKEPLVDLTLDTDEFPGGSVYDEAIHARAMALHYGPMAGRNSDSNRFRMASLVLLRNIKDGTEHGIVKKITYGRNKYMNRANYLGAQFYGLNDDSTIL